MSNEIKRLICSSTTKPKRLAYAILKEIDKHKPLFIDCIGANAINNTVKAISYAQEKKPSVFCKPYFILSETKESSATVVTRFEVW